MQTRILAFCCAFGAVLPGSASSLAWAQSKEDSFDYQVCCAGDVDNNGTSDFLIGRSGLSSLVRDSPWFDCGSLNLCSFGKQNGVRARLVSDNIEDRLGESLAVIEIAGKSSEGKCLAGEPGFDHGRGRLLLLSNSRLERLQVIEGSTTSRGFGAKIQVLQNGAERPRVALVSCEPAASTESATHPSSIALLSLETWTVVAEHAFEQGEKLGRCGLAWIPDQDADGSSDVAIGIINSMDASGREVGRVEIHSGTTLAILATIHGTEPGGEFGTSIAPIGSSKDSSGSDLLIGAPGRRAPLESGSIVALHRWDLASKRLRPVFETPCFEARAGDSVVSLGDIDGDGRSDIAMGAPRDSYLMQSECGLTWVLSGANRAVMSQGYWRYEDGHTVGLTFDGFGGRLSTFDIVRNGRPCSVLAVASRFLDDPMPWVDGVVFFDIARIAKSDRLERAALWDAAYTGIFRLRTVQR